MTFITNFLKTIWHLLPSALFLYNMKLIYVILLLKKKIINVCHFTALVWLRVFWLFFSPQVRCLPGIWPIIFIFMLQFTKGLQYSTVCYPTAGTQSRECVYYVALQFSDQDNNCNQWSFEFIYQVMNCSSEKQIYSLLRTES